MLASLILIFSSLAGCLDAGNDASTDTDSGASLGVVMVSTYHIGELVKGIAGDQVTMEYMSQDNIPVHDYEPSTSDLIRLQNADVFFYHGLGLEPWVEATLSSLGDDAPTSIEVHTMPDGQDTLDYEGVLVDDLCKTLAAGPYENIELVDEEEHADDVEIHAEYTAYNVNFHVEDHDEEGHDEHDEDDHDEEGHDDHDDHDEGHEGHAHIEAEETIANPEGCPSDSVISIFNLEEGEYVLEFDADHPEEFTMAVLKMGGGHAHHHHDHGDGPFEWAGIFSVSDSTHTWTMEKVDGSYADPSMRVVLIPTDAPTEETMHTLESGVEALIEGDCAVVEDGETMTPIAAGGSCFELHVGTGDISTFTMDTAGMSGFAAYTAHSPYEFEATQHYLKDSQGNDVEHIAEEGGGGHGDHGDHGEEHGDEHGVCHDMADHTNNDIDNEADCEAGGFMWMEDDDHDEHEGDYCHDTASHTNTNHTTEEDCEAAGHMWMEEDGHDGHHDEEMTAEHMIEAFDADNDSHLSWNEFWAGMEADHDDHHDENETHDEDEHMEEYLMWMFNQSDMDVDGLLNMTEINHLIELMESDVPTPEQALIMADANDDDHISWDEFWNAWASEDDHDDHHSEMVCYDMSTHTVDASHTTESDCEAAGLMWTAASGGDDDHDAHDDHEEEMVMEIFNESDMDGDGLLNMSELEHFIEDLDAWENPPMGYMTLHVEAEGEYGFAHPADIEFHLMMAEGGHEGHDDHAGHDDHDDHDDHGDEDEHDEDEEGDHDDHGDEESLNFDPHSWLNPLAFKAQVTVVQDALAAAFPSGAEKFQSNADAYSAELTALDAAFNAAFGEDGTCSAGGQEKTVAANHNAYSYIAVQYDIQFVTVHGLDPEGEPSPEDVAKVVNFINEEGISVLFVEEYTDQSSVQSIVDETGVEIKILYTMEMAPSDSSDDYVSMMSKNIENLADGMGC